MKNDWYFPLKKYARLQHFFANGRSLCGRYSDPYPFAEHEKSYKPGKCPQCQMRIDRGITVAPSRYKKLHELIERPERRSLLEIRRAQGVVFSN